MLRDRQRPRESCDLLNQDCVLDTKTCPNLIQVSMMPIDALPDDLDALRALVSCLSSERDAAIEECRRVREQNDRLHHLLRQLQRPLPMTHGPAMRSRDVRTPMRCDGVPKPADEKLSFPGLDLSTLQAGVRAPHVPYQQFSQAIADLISGSVQYMFVTTLPLEG
jgi:hypothetical protein